MPPAVRFVPPESTASAATAQVIPMRRDFSMTTNWCRAVLASSCAW